MSDTTLMLGELIAMQIVERIRATGVATLQTGYEGWVLDGEVPAGIELTWWAKATLPDGQEVRTDVRDTKPSRGLLRALHALAKERGVEVTFKDPITGKPWDLEQT